MAASPAFATVTEFLTAHPEVIPAFKADPGATMAAHGYFLSEANIDLINSILDGAELAPDARINEQQARMLATI